MKGVGSQAQVPPGAQRDAILLPWSLRIPCRRLTYDTAPSTQCGMAMQNKALEGNPSLLQYETQYETQDDQDVPLATLQLFHRRLWPTKCFFEINSATMDLTRLTHQSSAYLLGARTCSKSDRACVLDLSSKSLWSSLVSCEDMSQARNQSMAACSKLKHAQIPH